MKRHLVNILIFLVLIDGVNPFLVVNSFEHLPYGVLLGLLAFRISRANLIFLCLLGFIYILSVSFLRTIPSLVFFVPYVSTLNLLSFLFIDEKYRQKLPVYAYYAFLLYILVGIVQVSPLSSYMHSFLKYIIPRYSEGSVGGYRGVQMLQSEPARASFILFMLYVISLPYVLKINRYYLVSALVFIAQIFLIKSTTGMLMCSLYLLSYFLFASVQVKLAISVFIFISGSYLLFLLQANPKVVLILNGLLKADMSYLYDVFSAVSGGRFLALTNTVSDIVSNPMGYGYEPDFFDGEKVYTSYSKIDGYIVKVNPRPVSSLLVFMYTFGIIPFVYVFYKIKSSQKFSTTSLFVTLCLFFYSSPYSAVCFIALFFSFRRFYIR